MNVIECFNLTKTYKDVNALHNFSLSLEENKIIGLIGRNGAGKTTFLKTCTGNIIPTLGEIRIFNEKVFDNLNVLSNIIFVDEEVQYDTSMILKDILALARIYYKNWDNAMANRLIDFFCLNVKKKYKKLSRGMKTQFNIIMGICSRMPLTLFDEPTLGLDAAFRKSFYNILLKDYLNYPRTIIISSHLLSEIEAILEEIVLIKDGELIFIKPIEEVQNYGVYVTGKHETVKAFSKDKKILSRQLLGNSLSVGIENNMTDNEMEFLKNNNIEVSKMNAQDVCINLTANEKDGVFDDFEF